MAAQQTPRSAVVTGTDRQQTGDRQDGVPATVPATADTLDRRQDARLRAALVAAFAVTAVVLVGSALLGASAAPTLVADPGPVTRWGLLFARTGYDVAAIGTLGVLLVATVLLPPVAGKLGPDAERLMGIAKRWAVAYAAMAVLAALFTLSDQVGAPVWKVLTPDALGLAVDLEQSRALLVSAWLAGLVALFARGTTSLAMGVLLLLIGAGGLVPPLLGGHAGHGQNYALAVTSILIHVAGAIAWVGGLAALAVHLRRSPEMLRVALPRYSAMALVAFVAVLGSGVYTGWVALPTWGSLFTTGYGQLLLGKTAALIGLGWLGYRHRRRTLAAVADRRPGAFVSLAAVELVVMCATLGLAVALTYTAPPNEDTHSSDAAPTLEQAPAPRSI